MPVSYITHKGKEILHVDFKDIKNKTVVLGEIDEMAKFYRESTKEILLLLDVRGTFTDPEVMDKLKSYGKTVFKGKSRKRAILGVSGVKKLLLKAYSTVTNTSLAAFEDIEEAKDYLAS